MKKTQELKKLYTAHVSEDKPVVQEWVGVRAGDSAFICTAKMFSGRRRAPPLRRQESSKVFDSAEAAVASLKPVKAGRGSAAAPLSRRLWSRAAMESCEQPTKKETRAALATSRSDRRPTRR